MKKKLPGNVTELWEYFRDINPAIREAWQGVAWDGYQGDYQNILGPFAVATYRALPFFRGRSVLDIGSNSGQNSLALAFFASKVVGAEVQEGLVERSVLAKNLIAKDFSMDHVSFTHGPFTECLNLSLDAFFACKVLYWLGDEDLSTLIAFLRNQQDFKIFVHTVPGRDKAKTEMYNGAIETDDVKELLQDCGFGDFVDWSLTHGGHTQAYIYAEKTG